jgi:periplasmic protein TonB
VSGFRLPLALSLAAHAVVCAALLLLPTPAPPMTPMSASGGIEVAFAPSLPKPETPPAPKPVKAEPPPPQPMPPPPEPTPAVTAPPAIEPPPPAPEAAVVIPETPPPPPPKPPVPRLRRAVVQHLERARPTFAAAPPIPAGAPGAPTQQAALAPARVPAPAPPAIASPGYEALLGAWLNRHKRYPESARERGEQGRAVLHFTVERSGRVTEFAVIKSSGYPDLDAALESMMRGATLPPFPADMGQPSIEVSVTIRFSLEG